jgi:sulfide dehydrogenase cytochrome subunit
MAVAVRSLLLALWLGWVTLTPAVAQSLQARDWAGACTACHSGGDLASGNDGNERSASGAIPAIAGMDKLKFVELMTAFRNGTRESTVMHQLANGLSNEQIDLLGEYFSSHPPH